VCERGGLLGLLELLEPQGWLLDLARTRGWVVSTHEEVPGNAWNGIRHRFEGVDIFHSAWLAAKGDRNALAARIWEGQVEALFPLLESWRQLLIQRYKGLLSLPWPTDRGEIRDARDLEFGHLVRQLGRHKTGALREAVDVIGWLRDIRNHLAHFEPIPVRLLSDSLLARRLLHLLES